MTSFLLKYLSDIFCYTQKIIKCIEHWDHSIFNLKILVLPYRAIREDELKEEQDVLTELHFALLQKCY